VVIDYVTTKYCLASTVTTTCRGADALRCVDLAVHEAQRLLSLDDLRGDRGVMDIIDAAGVIIGQAPAPIALVSGNGSCYRGNTFRAAFDGDDPVLCPVRTRVRSPQTNGVVERLFETLKYEHLYRAPIDDGDVLAIGSAAIRPDLQHHPTPPSPRRPHTTTGVSTCPSQLAHHLGSGRRCHGVMRGQLSGRPRRWWPLGEGAWRRSRPAGAARS
jgi:transposase InsO family protein